MTPITYIGKRATYRDALYGTNLEFAQGQTHPVPDATARLMLRHPDQYTLGEVTAEYQPDSEVPTVKTDADEERRQEARDSVAHMAKDALQKYAKTNFGVEVDKRLGTDTLRQRVVTLIDQYGLS